MKDLIVSPGMKGCYVNRELSWLQFNSRVLEAEFCLYLPK